ncbi:D-ribose pyranase [Asanoa ferruginea]|uniref:D-ribose pyranase n=1 Tax=Asanoa ferruginea TaxID=53367 RepID=A0A3D9ZS05_9ACTN|nr:D-ribose pyranase [Asanoa ferruginea]REG00167.1 D-ribose pyranase [Asanoa ferruginea]GIF46134.1 D-ribose pyranase [Asanoa ferruginea]
MRKTGLWHPRLAALVAGLGHTETIVVADAGLPVPPDVEVVQLAVTRGVPPFLPVLEAIADELVVESATVATELTDRSVLKGIRRLGVSIEAIGHEDFKQRCRDARAVVRTGEATPYANVILRAGVPF